MSSKLWWDIAIQQDLSESHEAMLVFLHRLLSDLTVFKVACLGDRTLLAIVADLETRIVSAGVVLLLNDSLAACEAIRSADVGTHDEE